MIFAPESSFFVDYLLFAGRRVRESLDRITDLLLFSAPDHSVPFATHLTVFGLFPESTTKSDIYGGWKVPLMSSGQSHFILSR